MKHRTRKERVFNEATGWYETREVELKSYSFTVYHSQSKSKKKWQVYDFFCVFFWLFGWNFIPLHRFCNMLIIRYLYLNL